MARQDKGFLKFPAIEEGSTIGLIAVSSPSQSERLNRGVNYLKSLGFKVKVALSPSAAYGSGKFLFSSDTPEARAEALESLFLDREVRAVLAVRGGYGCQEMLPLLNFARLRKNPKPLIGSSDVTALLVALMQKARIVSIHGPTLESSFAKCPENADALISCNSLVSLLRGLEMPRFADYPMRMLSRGGESTLEGELIGGNLSILASLVGTPWQPDLRNKLLFLEELDEKPYRIHRMLLQMKYAGIFDELLGVFLGSFRRCSHDKGVGPGFEQVITEVFHSVGATVYGSLPFGHEDLNLSVPLGVKARIKDNKLEFLESAVLK